MSNNWKDSLIEAAKEIVRLVLLAVIPVLGVQLESGSVDLKMLAILGAIATLRGIDKFLHEESKEKSGDLP